jgi:hypothetical protein
VIADWNPMGWGRMHHVADFNIGRPDQSCKDKNSCTRRVCNLGYWEGSWLKVEAKCLLP